MSSVYISHSGSHTNHFQLEITNSSEVERRILMFAEMTPGPKHTLIISRTGLGRDCCILYKQQEFNSDKINFFSKSKTKDPKSTKSTHFITKLKFCFKDRTKMELREQTSDPVVEGTEGSLRDLASKWFLDTQVAQIVNNGLFPSWFLGFITRKNAEEILKEKELGCFLIRLSDRAIGYVLSYRGKDRCRHFVINQSETGQFVVCGDTEGHNTVPELIDYYHTSPIEPFGEYLTSSCFEVHEDELYDIIQVSPKEKLTVPPAKNQKQQTSMTSEQQPTQLFKNNKTQEEVPPLPRRSRPVDDHLNNQDKVLYAQLRKQKPREAPKVQHYSQDHLAEANLRQTSMDQNTSRCSSPSEPESVYSELNPLESKCRSLPLLESNSDGDPTYRLSIPPSTPPRLSPRPVRPLARCSPPAERADVHGRTNSYNLDLVSDAGVYHLAGRPGGQSPISFENESVSPGQAEESVYAEVASESLIFSHDNTYEILPDHKEATKPKLNNRTLEPVEDNKRNNNHASRGLKNDKWKWFLPESKRKW